MRFLALLIFISATFAQTLEDYKKIGYSKYDAQKLLEGKVPLTKARRGKIEKISSYDLVNLSNSKIDFYKGIKILKQTEFPSFELDNEKLMGYFNELDIEQIKKYTSYGLYGFQLQKMFEQNIAIETVEHYKKKGIPIGDIVFYIEKELPAELVSQYPMLYENSFDLALICQADVSASFVSLCMENGIVAEHSDLIIALNEHEFDRPDLIKESQSFCSKYAKNIKWKKYGEIKWDEIDNDLNDIPMDLAKEVLSTYHSVSCMPIEDKLDMFKDLDATLKVDETMSLAQMMDEGAKVLGNQIDYGLVDNDPILNQFFNMSTCNLSDFWVGTIGDCDKYASLNRVIFDYMKQKFPYKFKNVYMANDLFGKDIQHAWNTIVIVNKDHLVMSYIDPTWADTGGILDAQDEEHFDVQVAQEKILNFCQKKAE